MHTRKAVTGQSCQAVVSDGTPSQVEGVEVLFTAQVSRKGPYQPLRESGPERNGHCVEFSDGVQLRVPKMLSAVDLEDEVPDSDRRYVRLNRVGGGKISGKITCL